MSVTREQQSGYAVCPRRESVPETKEASDCTFLRDYLYENPLRRVARRFLYAVIRTIFPPALRLIYGFHITGKENYEKLNGGAVMVYNHVHCLDCIMAACAITRNRIFYVTIQQNCDIPVVGALIKLLGAWPLPQNASGYRMYKSRCKQALKSGNIVVVCPEGERKKTYEELRPFKTGAFEFAAENNVPVLPCVIKKVKSKGKTALEFSMLEPIYAPADASKKRKTQSLCENTRSVMAAEIEKNNTR